MEQTLDGRFAAVDKRFDDVRDLWRAELHRVEEVLTPVSNIWKNADIAPVVNHSVA